MTLLVLLYISDRLASNVYGCTCANILRYYLILVSLLWNAAEAVTMYLMFVRVFDSHVSHFALKTGIVAWGALVTNPNNDLYSDLSFISFTFKL
jgi:hypothetical protein